MAEKDKATVMNAFTNTPTIFAVNPVIGPQVAQFLRAQQKILREAESFSEHWFDRRQAATESALAAAGDVIANAGSNPAASLDTMTQWQRHSMERVAEDFREWIDLCTRCAGHVATAEVAAGEDGLAKTAEGMASAAKTKHAIPV